MAIRLQNWRRHPNERPRKGMYLQIYPSALVNASRMTKIATSVHQAGFFDETHLVGVQAEGLPASEQLAPGLFLTRLKGSARRGNLGRVLRLLMWQPRVYARYMSAQVSVVAAHNVWVLPLAWLLARSHGATLVYNAHELETEAIAMKGVKQKIAQAIESRLITCCEIVSVVNEPIADWYVDHYDICRPVVVGNVPEVSDADAGLRDRLSIPLSAMLYIHTGHLAPGRNIPLLLEAFKSSPHHIVFLGDGPLRETIVRASSQRPNIHWLEPVEPDLIVSHVREADVGLCLIEHQLSLSDTLSSPNKLLESLAAGTPPLCTDLVEARRLLGPLAHGWILDDPSVQLAEALRRISKDDVDGFRTAWAGVKPWHEEVGPLRESFAAMTGQFTSSHIDPRRSDR